MLVTGRGEETGFADVNGDGAAPKAIGELPQESIGVSA
jgi:hypothetical protein